MKQLIDLHAIENGGLLYYKWKAAYLTRRVIANVHSHVQILHIALCLLLVSIGILKK